MGWYGALMPVYTEKSGDLVGCYHSGTDNEGRKDRATQPLHWTIDGWDEQLTDCTQDDQRSGFEEKNPPARVGRSLAGSNQRLMWVPMIIAGRAALHQLGLKSLWICFEIWNMKIIMRWWNSLRFETVTFLNLALPQNHSGVKLSHIPPEIQYGM